MKNNDNKIKSKQIKIIIITIKVIQIKSTTIKLQMILKRFKDWPNQPYVKGEKCTKCPEGFKHCQHGLCATLSYPIWVTINLLLLINSLIINN